MKDSSFVGILGKSSEPPEIEVALKGLELFGIEVLRHDFISKVNLVVHHEGIAVW